MKNCKTAGIYKCDINIDKLSKYVKDIMSINSKYEKELVKLFKTKYTLDDIMENTAKSKDIKKDVSKIFEYDKLIKLLDSKMSSLSEIHKNSKNIIPYKKGINNINISTSDIIKITEDYLKLKEIVGSDKFQRVVEGFERFEKEGKLISARIADEYKVGSDSEYITNIERFLGEDIVDLFYHPVYYGKLTLRTVINYKSALDDIIRRLYKEC